jgi:geranylgeranyl reductase family protein
VTPAFDVVIIGAGPAGSAAALRIARSSPDTARRTLLLDASQFPREKLCGGGLVPEADRFLAHLGADTGSLGVASVPIERIRFEYPGGRSLVESRRLFHVVHRSRFDAALLDAARKAGIEVHEGRSVTSLRRDSRRVVVAMRDGSEIDAAIVIGADGARSRVRRSLVGGVQGERFVALEALSPGHDGCVADDASSRTAVFDFRPTEAGVRGYAWDFPSLRNGAPWMNRGLAAGARSGDGSLIELFEHCLERRGLDPAEQEIQGAGAPFYDAARPQGSDRVLLAGDAVGIDPWFGEGISVALGTGILAANAAVDGLACGHLDFSSHAQRIRESAVGWSLERRGRVADAFYRVARIPGALAAFLGAEDTV